MAASLSVNSDDDSQMLCVFYVFYIKAFISKTNFPQDKIGPLLVLKLEITRVFLQSLTLIQKPSVSVVTGNVSYPKG